MWILLKKRTDFPFGFGKILVVAAFGPEAPPIDLFECRDEGHWGMWVVCVMVVGVKVGKCGKGSEWGSYRLPSDRCRAEVDFGYVTVMVNAER